MQSKIVARLATFIAALGMIVGIGLLPAFLSEEVRAEDTGDKLDIMVDANCTQGTVTVYGNPGQHFYLRLYVDDELIGTFPAVSSGEEVVVVWDEYLEYSIYDEPHAFSVLVGGNTWSDVEVFGGYHCVTGIFLWDFGANLCDEGVVVYWTALEFHTIGYNIYRSWSEDGSDKELVNEEPIMAWRFPGGMWGNSYEYLDTTIGSCYWLEELDWYGFSNWYGPVSPE